ncbi:serine/threonine-protein kinase [Actinomadura sp. CNU-125]|uniref:serine/threonine-protein kinase n=1 Tax=Actinomadura sp. CNU-125 TaxID=1904961 RepID=UPI00096A9903|nr:serine/threonine-protein kinase [Actinomadura sp. CNU-125]
MPETVGPGDLPGERYRIEAPLGTGGMAAVWRAHDLVLDRAVAVKVPRDDWPEEFTRRLRQEAQAAAGLSHPNITGVYDYGEHDFGDRESGERESGARRGVPYVVMELLDGETLADRLARGPLPWREAAAVCAAIGDALDAAHAAGIVHRDIKPANVFLTPVGVKVLDFGIAFTGPDPAGGPVLGTPAYTAPELLDGAPPSPAADVFSLGVVLRQALTGGPPEAAALPADVPAEVAGLCASCTRSASGRPASRRRGGPRARRGGGRPARARSAGRTAAAVPRTTARGRTGRASSTTPSRTSPRRRGSRWSARPPSPGAWRWSRWCWRRCRGTDRPRAPRPPGRPTARPPSRTARRARSRTGSTGRGRPASRRRCGSPISARARSTGGGSASTCRTGRPSRSCGTGRRCRTAPR